MKQSELLGKLMPGHPDVFPIIENIREKYKIPPIGPDDDPSEILLSRDDIDWEAVRQDIQRQVQEIPLLDEPEEKYVQTLKKLQDFQLDFPELDPLPEDTRAAIRKIFSMVTQHADFMLALLESKTHKPLTEIVFEYLLTGKTRDVPEEWFGKVVTMNFLGKPAVIAVAGEASNPKELAQQFKDEFTKTFGHRDYKITDTLMSTAEYLTMKLQGDSLKRLVERYKEKHPSEFPKDESSPEYRKTVQNQVDKMEKRIDRLKDVLGKITGDEK